MSLYRRKNDPKQPRRVRPPEPEFAAVIDKALEIGATLDWTDREKAEDQLDKQMDEDLNKRGGK